MKFIPFPPEVAKQSAEATRASYEKTKRNKPASHTSANALCFQKQDGTLRPVYDPYSPVYPEGSIPGYGTVHAHLRYYANDSIGYDYTVTDFRPLEVA